jgi:hypothetical protein
MFRCSAPAYPAVVVQQPTPTANKQQNGGANGGGGEGNGALVTVQQKQLMKLRIRRSLDQVWILTWIFFWLEY